VRAVVTTGPGQLQVVEVSEPEVAKGQALIRVARAGICGTDSEILSGAIPVIRPRIMGHEMFGTVELPGSRIPGGSRVLVNPSTWCGHCDLCLGDAHHLCRNGGLLGRDADGVFTEYVALGEDHLQVVPPSITDDAASVLQVLGTCVHAQTMIDVLPPQTAVVIGLGVSGLLHVQLLIARGLDRVIGISRSASKRALAERFGALATGSPSEAADLTAELTQGRGADLVVEAVGKEETLAQAIRLAGARATVLAFGTITAGTSGLPYYELYFKELTVTSPRAARSRDYARAIDLTESGRVDPAPLVTHRFPLQQAPEAFATLDSALKVVLLVA